MIKFNSKQEFIDALEARRGFWHGYDHEQRQKHEAEEQAWLESSRAKLRRALEMDYTELKEARLYLESTPSCPVLMEEKINKLLRVLAATQGKGFNVGPSGVWSDAYTILSHDPYSPKTVC